MTFPNGNSDTILLEKFYANEEDRTAETEDCHFAGRLANEPEASAALTGCPGAEDVELTILSREAPRLRRKCFKVEKSKSSLSETRGTTGRTMESPNLRSKVKWEVIIPVVPRDSLGCASVSVLPQMSQHHFNKIVTITTR